MSAAESTTANGVRPLKTHEIIARQLRDQILRGELVPGQRLPPEDELTERFGIARTTLREALRVLESQGLLTIRRGRGGGPEITHPSLAPAATALAVSLRLAGTTLGDLDEARRLIEPQLAGKLALSRSDDNIAALEAVIAQASGAAEREDIAAFGFAVALFHETLIECSGNNTLATVSMLLHDMVQAFYSDASGRSDRPLMRRAVRSYRRLVAYIAAGDQNGAIAHWQAQMSYTISSYDQNAPIPLPDAV